MTKAFMEKVCKRGRVETSRALYIRVANCIYTYKDNSYYPLIRRVAEEFRTPDIEYKGAYAK